MSVTTFAAISIGSYEIELKIFEISPKTGIREIDRISHVIELGRDTYNKDKISFEMVDKLCGILYDFSYIMKGYKVKAYRACATSAIREAVNSKNVLDRVKVRTGLDIELLSNSEQRFISYKAFSMQDEIIEQAMNECTLLADIGSGSAQITLFNKGKLITTQNIRLGVLRVRELLARLAQNADKYRCILEEYIDNDLETFTKIFLEGYKVTNIVGTGENLSYIKLTGEDKKYVTKKEFAGIYDRIIGKSEDEIAQQLDIPQTHASLVTPGLMLFARLFAFTDAKRLWMPDVKLGDGLAVDYAQKSRLIKLKHNFNDDILSATRQIAERYQCNVPHTRFVEKAALGIFDAMKKLHGLGERERLILQLAAIMHDSGKFVSLMYPSEAGYDIIMASEIIGISHEERETVAKIIKYNTRDFDYRQMNLTQSKLTAMLRLANALDRSHKQKMSDLKISLEGDELIIATSTYEDITLEYGLFKEKTELFEEIYGVRPVLRQRKNTR
jgi:hypothetical protein